MPLLLSGEKFLKELEHAGCIAIHVPLEGGAETRLLRRAKSVGYRTQILTARGLGDPESFLCQLHGVRPPHLGHQCVGQTAALGEVQLVTPQITEFLDDGASILIWLIEGQVFSRTELLALCALCKREPRLKIVVEVGGARSIQWEPMETHIRSQEAHNF